MKTKEKRKQTIVRALLSCLLIAVLAVVWVFGGGYSAPVAYAASSDDVAFDDTYVMDDLESMTINGKAFDITDYSFDESRNTGVIMFAEYCYSFYANKQGNYGLYVYVWNPQGLNIDVNSSLNMIEFGIDPDYSTSYSKYHLEFLSVCEETNYEGLFYKFKVYLTDSDKTYILNRLDSSERFYHVSGIELLTVGNTNATETIINLEYRYSGYAAGYGSNSLAESTLVCNTEQGEVLSLDVHSTYYRPAGSNGSENTQDTLHSVYFAVPNSILEEYGELTAVHATWLNALTSPIFVTGNYSVYSSLLEYIAVDIGQYSVNIPYGFVSEYSTGTIMGTSGIYYAGGFAYNFVLESGWGVAIFDTSLSVLNYIFYAGSGIDSADDYTLSAEEILAWLSAYTQTYGGDLVNDKYSSVLFDQVDSEFTDLTIRCDDTFSLTSVTTSQTLWQKIWGISTSYTNTYSMSAIEEVSLSAMDNALSVTSFCDSYYVAESDYDDLYDYVEEAESNDETVFLFRYYQSEYYSAEATEFETTSGLLTDYSSELDTNAYVAQMWVQLDFDIIDVTFTNGGVDTIIPVVSSPIDAVADVTSPLVTTSDITWWQIVLMALALVVLFVVLMPILPYIIKAVVWVIMLPFKVIAALFRVVSNLFHKRE